MKNIAAEKTPGLHDEFCALQRELVMNSFSVNLDQAKHKLLMDKLNLLKIEHRNIAKLNSEIA